jgi:MFS family permease
MMMPAALSILTTSFREGHDRNTALGAWGALAGLASAVGVFLGGVLSEGPGWRWVFFVNLPVCVAILVASFRLLSGERRRAPLANFDASGAALVTAGMLLLVYALVKAPSVGWGQTSTIAELAGAAALLAAFAANERRHPNPLVPLSIFRIKGLAAANLTQVMAMAGFYSMFFFVTLYMQDVLGYSQIQAGSAYLPVTLGVAVAAGVSSQLFARIGTRPVIVAGALLGAGGLLWLSRIPLHGSYLTDLLPGLMMMSFGVGAVFVGVTTAANAGVAPGEAGLAAALINASTWLGGALGIAIFSAIATSRTRDLLQAHVSEPAALVSGFHRALLAGGAFLLVAALTASRARNAREETAPGRAPATPAAAIGGDGN